MTQGCLSTNSTRDLQTRLGVCVTPVNTQANVVGRQMSQTLYKNSETYEAIKPYDSAWLQDFGLLFFFWHEPGRKFSQNITFL